MWLRATSKLGPFSIARDAGHKTVPAYAGVPAYAVLGRPELQPQEPGEEHLPIDLGRGDVPTVGDYLYLAPRHVSPAVNNFDHTLLVVDGTITGVERVTACSREAPVVF